jgi:hypothetical protein
MMAKPRLEETEHLGHRGPLIGFAEQQDIE